MNFKELEKKNIDVLVDTFNIDEKANSDTGNLENLDYISSRDATNLYELNKSKVTESEAVPNTIPEHQDENNRESMDQISSKVSFNQ